ncbi:MAG: hypothetical protein ACC646_11605 [Paracoccaceae bacterium]
MTFRDTGALEQDLLAAHSAGDTVALITLYTAAADIAEADQRTDAACFYLTHAYIFALDRGAGEAGELHARLRAHGREE